jgi:hypothetical protein
MKCRSRHLALTLLIGCAVVAAAPSTAAASKPSYGCAPGFNLGAFTFEHYLQLPGTQAAINDGLIDEASLLAGLAHYDANGNETVCVQSVPGWQISNKPFAMYLYNVVDDASSAP